MLVPESASRPLRVNIVCSCNVSSNQYVPVVLTPSTSRHAAPRPCAPKQSAARLKPALSSGSPELSATEACVRDQCAK